MILGCRDINRGQWDELVRTSETGNWFQSVEAYSFYESMPELFRPFVVAIARDAEHLDACGRLETESLDAEHLDACGRLETMSLDAGHLDACGRLETESLDARRLEPEALELRGICVGYVTVERNRLKQYFTRRAIIFGGPALADDATDEEAYALMQAVRNQLKILCFREARSEGMEDLRLKIFSEAIYVETRKFGDYGRWKGAFERAGFVYKPHYDIHVDCSGAVPIETVLSDNRRRQVKRALAAGAEIGEARNEGDIGDWYEILAKLYKTKVRVPLPPKEFFIEFYRQKRGIYLMVRYKGRVIGGMMCPIMEGKAIYEWYVCGDDEHYHDQYPSVMATWAAIEYANKKGIKRFDFMGAGEPGVAYGVRDFKMEFGGELVEHGRFIAIGKPLLYRVGVLGVKILKRLK